MGKFYNIYTKVLEILGYLILFASIDRLVFAIKRPKLTIFMYHGITLEKEPLNEVTVKNVQFESFRKQLNYVRKRFHLLTLESAIKKIKENTLPRISAVLTFDDGYENNYSLVFPLLKKYGIKATIFLTGATDSKNLNWNDKLEAQILKTDKKETLIKDKKYSLVGERDKINTIVELKSIGNKLNYSELQEFSKKTSEQLGEATQHGNYKILTWQQVNEMRNYGIEFGAHSVNHPGLQMQNEETLNYEIGEIKNIIAHKINTEVKSFSYPTGLYNDDCVRVVKEQGYECAVTSNYGFNNQLNLYELERIAVGKHMSLPLFVLNLIIQLYKIDKLVFNMYHKIFKRHDKSINQIN